MAKAKVIPYGLVKHIIIGCPTARTKALMAFQYAMAARAGELAMQYTHKKQKWNKREKKMVEKGRFVTGGIRRDQFFETDDGLRWEAPNFKNKKKTTKKAWLSKQSEQWLYKILKSWLDKTETKYLFKIGEQRIRKLVGKELKKQDEEYRSHCLRHSRATHIADVSGDPFVVQAVLGHGRLETSALYVNIAEDRLRQKLAGKSFEEILGKKV